MNFLDIGKEKNIYADGVHDDTEALQACLDKMKDGGTIYFPDGIYLISSCLIFYSKQWLKFSDEAILLRSDKSENTTRYMLASYSEPDITGYNGTHDVVISGGIFDGNVNINEKLTIINTVHCTNIVIKNCRFRNGSLWHYIELNSTKDALVLDCVFDGKSYTAQRDNLTSELVQVDAPDVNTYGPVYNCKGELIDFSMDKTPCCDITIASCIFKCGGFPGIGHHGNYSHHNIEIVGNVFTGVSGTTDNSRGFVIFGELVTGLNISSNVFISDADARLISYGIVTANKDELQLITDDNCFFGNFSEEIKKI